MFYNLELYGDTCPACGTNSSLHSVENGIECRFCWALFKESSTKKARRTARKKPATKPSVLSDELEQMCHEVCKSCYPTSRNNSAA